MYLLLSTSNRYLESALLHIERSNIPIELESGEIINAIASTVSSFVNEP